MYSAGVIYALCMYYVHVMHESFQCIMHILIHNVLCCIVNALHMHYVYKHYVYTMYELCIHYCIIMYVFCIIICIMCSLCVYYDVSIMYIYICVCMCVCVQNETEVAL